MTFIYFVLVLGAVIFVHELGHFTYAKLFKVHVFEFSLGMGPQILKFKPKKSETTYSIRLFPIGGFVSMAGEEDDPDVKVKKGASLTDKPLWQRFIIMISGVFNNFVFAIVILFIISLVMGAPSIKPVVGEVVEGYPIAETGIKSGDTIVKIGKTKINSTDRALLELQLTNNKAVDITVRDTEGNLSTHKVEPMKTEIDGEEVYRYGIALKQEVNKGFLPALKYAFIKVGLLLEQMVIVIVSLITGRLGFGGLAGPVGIYSIVGESAKAGFFSLLYLVSYLSVNVGFINLIPFPAMDGGRILFLAIEKIKGSPISPKIENGINVAGFALLMLLMIIITFNDLIRLFG